MVVVKGMTVNKFECLKKIWINKKFLGHTRYNVQYLQIHVCHLCCWLAWVYEMKRLFASIVRPLTANRDGYTFVLAFQDRPYPQPSIDWKRTQKNETKILKKVIKSKCRRECENVKLSCIQKMVTLLISLPIVKFIAVIVGCNNV